MDKMKYLSKKGTNGEYILSDEKIHNFVKEMCRKYPLRTSVYPGDRVNELKRHDDCIEYTITRRTTPIRIIEDYCYINDFLFYSQNLNEDEYEKNAKVSFWLFMIGEFGKEYREDLKQHLIKTRDDEIKEAVKEATEEITEKYEKYADIVDGLCEEEELENC